MLAAELTGPSDAYRQGFVKALRGRGDIENAAGLQIATDFQPALWDNPTYGEWLAWEGVANIIPAWGATYVRSAGNRVTDAPQQFLTNLDVSGTAERSALRAARDTLGALRTAMEDERRLRAGLAAATARGSADQVRAGPIRTVAAARDKIWSLSQRLVRESETEGGDRLVVAKALLAFNNPAYQAELTDDHGGRLPYRTWSVRPSLSEFLADAKAGKLDPFGFAADLQAPPSLGASMGREDTPVASGFDIFDRVTGRAQRRLETAKVLETDMPECLGHASRHRSLSVILWGGRRGARSGYPPGPSAPPQPSPEAPSRSRSQRSRPWRRW
jgi:hypothetical protein